VLFDLANEVNRSSDAKHAALLRALGGVLGLLERDAAEFLQAGVSEGWTPARIEDLIARRAAAKKSKNYAEADALRKEALEAGIILEDSPQGTTWRRA